MNRHRTLLSISIVGSSAIAGTGGYFLGQSHPEAASEDPASVNQRESTRLIGGSGVSGSGKRNGLQPGKSAPFSEHALQGAIGSIISEPSPLKRMATLSRLLEGLTPQSLPAILKAFDAIPMRPGHEQEYALLIDAWAAFDPEGAIQFVKERANNRTLSKDSLLGSALASWARENPSDALDWFHELPEGERSHQVTRGLIEGWAVTDPTAASDYILANHQEPGEARERLVNAVVTQLLRTSTSAATAWAESIEDPKFREECFEELSESWASLDPVGLSKWLGQYVEEDFAKEAVEDLARGWVNVDPKAATDWVTNLPEGKTKDFSVYEMARTWAESDLTAVGEWLNTMDDSTATNMGVRAYAQNLLMTAPEAAVESASAITDSALREQTLNELMPYWHSQKPEEALAWAEANDYPIESLQSFTSGLHVYEAGFSIGDLSTVVELNHETIIGAENPTIEVAPHVNDLLINIQGEEIR